MAFRFQTIGDSERGSASEQSAIIASAVALLDAVAADSPRSSRTQGTSLDGSSRNWSAPDRLLSFDEEQTLFRALRTLHVQGSNLRQRLNPARPSKSAVDRLRTIVGHVEAIRSQLVRSNLRLVSSIARRFAVNFGDMDEFNSDGCLILLGAIDRFDYSRGYRFSTYATHSIQRHFFRAWKVRQRRKDRFPSASAELLAEVPEVTADEPLCDDPQSVVGSLLSKASEVLDHREHEILVNRFGLHDKGESRTLREVAADLGISKERVRQLQVKALDKLRALLDPRMFGHLVPAAG